MLQNNHLLITALLLNIMGLLFHDLAFVEYLKQHRRVSKVKTRLGDAVSRELTVITSCCFLMFFYLDPTRAGDRWNEMVWVSFY